MKSTGLSDFGGSGRHPHHTHARLLTPADFGASFLNVTSAHTVSPGSSLFIKLYETSRKVGLERSKARLSPVGVLIQKRTLQRRMETRLKLVDFVARHPSAAKAKFARPPIFVIGFPRTGTTFLHEVLGLHEEVRMHHSWEQMAPIPTTDDESPAALKADRKARHSRNRQEFNMTVDMAGPEIQAIHRVEYDAPEECTTLCAAELPWNPTELAFMACAAAEVLPLGAGEAFSFYKKYLQLLTWQCPDVASSTWMLKCPFHLPYLEDLHAAFPGSTVVWTHRHPVECVGSCCSLFEAILLLTIDSWTLDRKALGREILNYIRICLDRALKAIDKLSTLRVVHVKYTETTGKTLESCAKVCAATGLPFSGQYEESVKAYLAESKAKRAAMAAKGQAAKGQAGKLHAYSLEDYGLSNSEVNAEFKEYIEKYC